MSAQRYDSMGSGHDAVEIGSVSTSDIVTRSGRISYLHIYISTPRDSSRVGISLRLPLRKIRAEEQLRGLLRFYPWKIYSCCIKFSRIGTSREFLHNGIVIVGVEQTYARVTLIKCGR